MAKGKAKPGQKNQSTAKPTGKEITDKQLGNASGGRSGWIDLKK